MNARQKIKHLKKMNNALFNEIQWLKGRRPFINYCIPTIDKLAVRIFIPRSMELNTNPEHIKEYMREKVAQEISKRLDAYIEYFVEDVSIDEGHFVTARIDIIRKGDFKEEPQDEYRFEERVPLAEPWRVDDE